MKDFWKVGVFEFDKMGIYQISRNTTFLGFAVYLARAGSNPYTSLIERSLDGFVFCKHFLSKKCLQKTQRNENMKTIRVVAAVILSEGKIFATQRGYGDFKGGWEFPGGKIEDGETPEVALKREISEELETKIRVGELIDTIEYDYPNFHLSMDCFWCEIVSGKLVLKEHEAARWLDKENLYSVEWLPADVSLIEKIALKL